MQLQTIVNRVSDYKPFIVGKVTWDENSPRPTLLVQMKARKNSQGICSKCGKQGPGYDRLQERKWEFVPLWQIAVFLVYALRRVDCTTCGVTVEQVPWGEGKARQTHEFRWFLSRWARRLSWSEVAAIFGTSWDTVYRAVRHAVSWGLVHRDETGVTAIGVDEIQYKRGHKYLTLVYQLDASNRRLLWVNTTRTEEAFEKFFDVLGKQITPTLKYVCSDMWAPYLSVVRRRAGDAVHILDRFHIMMHFNKAIDEIRAGEARQMKKDGYEPVLKNSRWSLLNFSTWGRSA